MADGQLFTMAIWTVKEGKVEEVIEGWKKFAEWTLENIPGTEGTYMVQDAGNPRRLITFGPWASQEAVTEWRGSREYKEFFTRVRDLCDDIEYITGEAVGQVGKELLRA